MEAKGPNQIEKTMAERESPYTQLQDFDTWNFDGDPGQGGGVRTPTTTGATFEGGAVGAAAGRRQPRDLVGQGHVVDLAAVEDSFSWGAVSSSRGESGDSVAGGNGALQDDDGFGPSSDVGGVVEQTIKVESDTEVKKTGGKKQRPSWRYMADKVRASLQIPPPGPFSRTDLKWDTKCNQGRGRRPETN